jgi:hypothetical protein
MRVGSDVLLIARQGDNVYLVEVEPINGESMARVLDLTQKRLLPIAPLANLLARGYWKEYAGKPGELERLLALVKHTPSADSGSVTRTFLDKHVT